LLLREERVQRDAERQVLLTEQPGDTSNSRFYGVLAKGFVHDVRISTFHIGPEVRAVAIAPDFHVKDEANRDFLSSGSNVDVNGLARKARDPVCRIFAQGRFCRGKESDDNEEHVNGWTAAVLAAGIFDSRSAHICTPENGGHAARYDQPAQLLLCHSEGVNGLVA
ncbi:MAG: hypothetical protein JOZ17_24490, partial [Acetobacteraceae bacterium]|nr:hypothetical protein [Acetobacteraceae bacterium]